MPPEWWNISLYAFLNGLLPEGWVWEFMRRDRLREVLGGRQVDAMNPEPDVAVIQEGYSLNYYKPYNHPFWQRMRKLPYFLPPAVNLPDGWPRGFSGQQYRIDDDSLRQLVQVNIDISRRDKVILRDFENILGMLRVEHPQPRRTLPKFDNWRDQHILPVWDLREFNISWRRITELVGFDDPEHDISYAIQKARNAFNTAQNYINNGKWKELARYIDI